MSNPRLKRLQLDEEQLKNRFHDWPLIHVRSMQGIPAEKYLITYFLNGLYVTTSGQILERREHLMEINLSLNYPRRAPQCKMLTPVFHPNFDESSVCIGDFWAASEGLDDLVIRIGRMIAYQDYNTKSPLNGIAAKWAEEHSNEFPVDNRDVSPISYKESKDDMEALVIKFPPEARLDVGEAVYQLDGSEVTIGRGEESRIVISDPSLSKFHSEIYYSEGKYCIRDLNSTNGTFVNNIKVDNYGAPLEEGDVIILGNHKCRFLLGAD